MLGIDPEEIKGNAHQLMALARVRAWLNLDGVPELAYRARRSGFDDPDIHQAYMSLVLHRKRDEDSVLQIAKAQPGSTVHLESEEGGIKVFTIVEGLDADLHRGELLPSDPVALRLLGLGVGDSVYLKQTELDGQVPDHQGRESVCFCLSRNPFEFLDMVPRCRGPRTIEGRSSGN